MNEVPNEVNDLSSATDSNAASFMFGDLLRVEDLVSSSDEESD